MSRPSIVVTDDDPLVADAITRDLRQRFGADYRIVPYVTKPGAPVRTHSSWVVENNRRGVRKVSA